MTDKQYKIFLKAIKFKTKIVNYEHSHDFDFFEKEDIKLLSEFISMLCCYAFCINFKDIKSVNTDKKYYFVINSPFTS